MMSTEPTSPTEDQLAVPAILHELDKRIEARRLTGRDIDNLVRQLSETAESHWPVDPDESTALAVRTLVVLAQLLEPHEGTPTRTIEAALGVSLARLAGSLPDATELSRAHREQLAWLIDELEAPLACVVTELLLDSANDKVLESLAKELFVRVGGKGKNIRELLEKLKGPTPPSTVRTGPRHRESLLMLARIRSRTSGLKAALETLENEPVGDPRVVETYAMVYAEHQETDEAVQRLKKAVILHEDGAQAREALVQLFLNEHDTDNALDQLLLLLTETGDIMYWYVVTDVLSSKPDILKRIVDRLRDESPALYVEILMSEGDHEAVVEASRGKTFSHIQLWRVGDFLAEHDPRSAAKIYERAITLQGAVAQSKVQAADLGTRIEAVSDFFVELGRPTKLRRIARQVMSRQKHNIPLKREFERVFGKKFG